MVEHQLPKTYKEALEELILVLEEQQVLKTKLKESEDLIRLLSSVNKKPSYQEFTFQHPKELLSNKDVAKDYGMPEDVFSDKVALFLADEFGLETLMSSLIEYGFLLKREDANYWTKPGRLFLYDVFNKEGVLPVCERG